MYILHTNRARIKDNHADEFLININWGTALLNRRRPPADDSHRNSETRSCGVKNQSLGNRVFQFEINIEIKIIKSDQRDCRALLT